MLNSVVFNHLALNLYIAIPLKLISAVNALSDFRNEAGHNDTPYVALFSMSYIVAILSLVLVRETK